MVKALWGSFPRLVEQNINGLLDTAEPNNKKAFMLYKACKNDDLWRESFETFSSRLTDFFSRPRAQRRKSQFDAVLDRPMNHAVYAGFHLDFRTAYISEQSVNDIASWAYNLIRVTKKVSTAFASLDVLNKTLHSVVNPPIFEKAENIEFEDFCAAWKKTVFRTFGRAHDPEFTALLKELNWINGQLKEQERTARREIPSLPTITLTQTEIDWAVAVRFAALQNTLAPEFPLARAPEKKELQDLSRVIALYHKARTTKVTEVIRQRENIRATLVHQCDLLLQGQAA